MYIYACTSAGRRSSSSLNTRVTQITVSSREKAPPGWTRTERTRAVVATGTPACLQQARTTQTRKTGTHTTPLVCHRNKETKP